MTLGLLNNQAEIWWSSVIKKESIGDELSWIELKTAFLEIFRSIKLEEEAWEVFKDISRRQNETVNKFAIRFNGLVEWLEPKLGSDEALSKFVKRLIESISFRLKLIKPRNLDEAMFNAIIIEYEIGYENQTRKIKYIDKHAW